MYLHMDEAATGQAILSILRDISANTYFDRAPRNAAMPYAVFTLGSIFQGEGTQTTFMLNINIWDNEGNSIIDLLTLSDNIKKNLHKLRYKDDDVALYFSLESDNPIPDPQEQLRRRELRFEVTYYRRN